MSGQWTQSIAGAEVGGLMLSGVRGPFLRSEAQFKDQVAEMTVESSSNIDKQRVFLYPFSLLYEDCGGSAQIDGDKLEQAGHQPHLKSSKR